MKVALAQLNYHIGNFEKNTQKIITSIKEAKSKGTDLIVFAELAICGYSPLDLLELDDFITDCNNRLNQIAKECVGIAAVVGVPTINNKTYGKPLFNSAVFIENGQIKAVSHKTLLPNYDIFDECRYFESNEDFHCVEFNGYKIALPICEDLWNLDKHPLYKVTPMDELIKQKPDLIINIAASPFNYAHQRNRLLTLQENAKRYKLPLVYVNNVGANTDLIFDGGSMVINESGGVIKQLPHFEEAIDMIDLSQTNTSINVTELGYTPNPCSVENISSIHKALVLGLKDYFLKLGFSKAILGMSGGLDSAVVLALVAEALGADNVLPIMMPSQYSSDHSVSDSQEMISRLGCFSDKIPISQLYQAYETALESQFKGLPVGLAEENLQARIRGVLLMAISNKKGYILLNTSNKSELAVGYSTLYGDMCGGLSVIGDLYKTQVYALARHINRDKEIIPVNIINKAPSAELRPNQKDTDSLPNYEVLDNILCQYIEGRNCTESIIASGVDESTVKRIIQLVDNNEYKRFQTAPVLRISPKSFGYGRKIPIVSVHSI